MKQVSPFRKSRIRTSPNQYICYDVASGIICNENYYPYFALKLTNSATSYNPGKIKRVFVKSCCAAVSAAGLVAEDSAYIYGYINNKAVGLFVCKIPALAAGAVTSYVLSLNSGYLMDAGSVLQSGSDVAALYEFNVQIAEVDVLPGEQNPTVVVE